MTKPGIDIEREVHHTLFDVMDLTVGLEKELREKFIALCLRVEQAAIKAERDRCTTVLQERIDFWEDEFGTYGNMRHECRKIKNKILGLNGETK